MQTDGAQWRKCVVVESLVVVRVCVCVCVCVCVRERDNKEHELYYNLSHLIPIFHCETRFRSCIPRGMSRVLLLKRFSGIVKWSRLLSTSRFEIWRWNHHRIGYDMPATCKRKHFRLQVQSWIPSHCVTECNSWIHLSRKSIKMAFTVLSVWLVSMSNTALSCKNYSHSLNSCHMPAYDEKHFHRSPEAVCKSWSHLKRTDKIAPIANCFPGFHEWLDGLQAGLGVGKGLSSYATHTHTHTTWGKECGSESLEHSNLVWRTAVA